MPQPTEGVNNGGGVAPPSVRLTRRSDRSRPMHLLQKTVKIFRPNLVAPPKKPWPAGSIRLNPPSSAEKRCTVRERKRADVWTYELVPNSLEGADESKAQLHIYYFAGSSFQNVPSDEHWKTVAAISTRLLEAGLRNARVHMVSPPLAPNSPARDSLRTLRAWIEDVLQEAHGYGWSVSLAGDSSGGNLAATLAIGVCGGWPSTVEPSDTDQNDKNSRSSDRDRDGQQLSDGQAETDAAKAADGSTDPLCMPRSPFASALAHVLLICPALDKSNTNPRIQEIGLQDPLLTPEFTGGVADSWRGTSNVTSNPSHQDQKKVFSTPVDFKQIPDKAMRASDPRVSPVMADLNVLKELHVIVDGLIAGLDSLAPDAERFVGKLHEAGVGGEWQLWEMMMHCWVLTWWGGLREGKVGLEWVVGRFAEAARKTGS